MLDDATLLRRFARERSERDFAELVQRHLPMVYGAALRRLGGDTHLAQDVAQTVFADLARKAPALTHHRVLAGWLHTAAVFAAAKTVRTEQRRRTREEEARLMHEQQRDDQPVLPWERVRPVLDEALQRLRAPERDAILLRFFAGRDFATIGAALRVSESGARMRVERALDRLRVHLARRGIASTGAALASALAAHGAVAPPAGLAVAVASSSLTGAASVGGATTLFNLVAMTKVQAGLTAVLLAATAVTVGVQHHERAELRAEVARASAAAAEQPQLRAEIAQLQQAAADAAALRVRSAEFATLRQEITQQVENLTRLQANAPTNAPARQSPRRSLAAGTETFEMTQLDQQPAATFQVPPQYPFAFKAAGLPGEALLSFVIDPAGRVANLEVLEASHPDFGAAAAAAVESWRYRPGQKDGLPVGTKVQMPVVFNIANDTWF